MLPLDYKNTISSGFSHYSNTQCASNNLSYLGRIILNSLENMNITDNQHKLKINGCKIEQRSLSEAGGESFNQQALHSFCQSIVEFLNDPSTPLAEILLIEQALPKAMKGLSHLKEEVYSKKYFTEESWAAIVLPTGVLRSAHKAEIEGTIAQLERIHTLIQLKKEEISALRSAGLSLLIENNHLNEKTILQIASHLKNWGMLEFPYNEEDFYAPFCQALQNLPHESLSLEEKYEVLSKCIFLAGREASSQDFNSKEMLAHFFSAFASVAAKKGQMHSVKRQELQGLIDFHIERNLTHVFPQETDPLENSFVFVNEEELENLPEEWATQPASSLFQKVLDYSPTLFENACKVFATVEDLPPSLKPMFHTAGKVAEGLKLVSKGGITSNPEVGQFVMQEVSDYVMLRVIKDPENMLYDFALAHQIPQMGSQAFAQLTSGLNDSEFRTLLKNLKAKGALQNISPEALSQDRKVTFSNILNSYFGWGFM